MSDDSIRVVRWQDCDQRSVQSLMSSFGLDVVESAHAQAIPGSFWGDSEAGLIQSKVYVRTNTPLHSILHESCHYICMSPKRRADLDTNAGGDYDEENAVCYLQILLADEIRNYSADQCMRDMDAWGYSFRLGSARAWFERDAEDALLWLDSHGLGRPGNIRNR